MKKQILTAILIALTTVTFAQKKEIKKAEKAVKSGDFTEAMVSLNEAEPMLSSADNETKAMYYAIKGDALVGSAGDDYAKLKMAADAYAKVAEFDTKGSMSSQTEVGIQNLRAKLVNSAILDQNAQRYKEASEKLYTSYMTSKKDTSDLYFAAGNAVNGRDYPLALSYYEKLMSMGYTGITKEYIATNKATGEVETFQSKNDRDFNVKAGEYIKPLERFSDSRRGEILRNMTLIYIEQGETEKAVALMKTARAENPKDVSLIRAEADMAYKMGDIPKYNTLMGEIVATDPTNPEIYYNLGVGAAQIGDKEKALDYYMKALELNPEYASALINVSVLKLAEEKEIVDTMNSLGTSSADNKKYDALKEKRNNLYVEAAPYLEKALLYKKDNVEVVRTLMNIYSQLGQDDKFKAMKVKLAEIEAKN